MKQAYITTIIDLLQSGLSAADSLAKVKSVIEKRGHDRLWPSVLRGLLVELEQSKSQSIPKVVLAKEGSVSESDIKLALSAIGAPTDHYETELNANIIGGVIATHNNRRLDKSYQTKLLELYQSITAV